jgi:DNA-3-methyladenine glycosylase
VPEARKASTVPEAQPVSLVLPRDFFARNAVDVAPHLLGCVLERESAGGLVAVQLTEVEAYMGEADPASHAYRGQTQRNAVMFGPPGHAYVYFTYGMHFCVNLVCLPEGTASAVLLRAGRVVQGAELAAARRRIPVRRRTPPRSSNGETSRSYVAQSLPDDGRGLPGDGRVLAGGPARLCQALAIDRSLNGADVCDPCSALRVRRATAAEARYGNPAISSGPRVGVTGAAEVPWRFWLAGDPTVSAYRPHVPRRRPRKPVVPEARNGDVVPEARDGDVVPEARDGEVVPEARSREIAARRSRDGTMPQ